MKTTHVYEVYFVLLLFDVLCYTSTKHSFVFLSFSLLLSFSNIDNSFAYSLNGCVEEMGRGMGNVWRKKKQFSTVLPAKSDSVIMFSL